uniref:Uncharacterized protein n=1 Tax=Caloglossa monosticha TaxID=76906 RepID=A0A1Z1M4P0_9FLOR|nr:hypothetical protein [Caloglossa monosticha]ARW61028.1 hypothetical protein [Caloglossa monosticha]
MNKYIVTAQILDYIKLKTKKKEEIFLMLLYIPNNIKNTSFVKIFVNLNNSYIHKSFKLYQINDICSLEGTLHIVKNYCNQYRLFTKIDQIFWFNKD